MFKLSFYVPESHLEVVKSALFNIGVGKIGYYDSCCWQTLGQGQFRALEGSEPYLGQQGKVEIVAEFKVEMVCEGALITEAVGVLKQAHPYEEPAYDVVKLTTIDDI
ncbi:MAG: NGG1p interacting factor NIF3 [SAR86 cluster bacterium]|uniref:NGG1p interacting factor NIF3 n=1 Tax=SAR86 cluster bacterium TaxID=2030880 RepID=A0A2A5CBD2_9GAMM|nr:NGG1p interacting factor NIF3 [Gammaproteobacteria bacterium AH-315-E17]PCJ41122.1 MAG: NGG1p interacting factor NIF3 [SAR86 cluster bacterium]